MTSSSSSKAAVFVRAPEPGASKEPADVSVSPVHAVDHAAARDARALRASLVHAFAEDPSDVPAKKPIEAPADAPPKPAKTARTGLLTRAWLGRFLKAGVGVAVVVFFGWMPLQSLLVASSAEAVVNSRIVTVRSPIDGVVAAAPHDSSAWSAAKGAPVLRIVDDKADRTQLDSLRRQLGNLEDERPSLAARLDLTRASLEGLDKQTQEFTAGRIRQLDARIAALNHDLTAASARAEEAEASLTRGNALTSSGALTVAEIGRLRRDSAVAVENEAAARQRLEEASVELAAAHQGFFLGDSYNDRPSSAQRADEMRLRVGDLAAELKTRDAEFARLRADVAEEAGRYKDRSDVEVALPVSGRVWEVLTAPGEHVSRGQDLLRLLDCASAVVTANVGESIYNRLQVGSPVTFRPSTGGESYPGAVVNLTGAAGAPANFAILPSTLVKEGYHVTVAVPHIAQSGECGVGRTGRVIFEQGPAESSASVAEANALGLRP